MNKAKMKIFEEYYLRRSGTMPPDDLFKVGVELSTWLHLWVDECADLLDGKRAVSATKVKALRRLVPLVEQAYGKKFPATPKNLKMIDGGYRDIKPDDNQLNQGDTKMSDTEKKSVKKAAPAKAVKKAAPKAASAKAVKKAAPKAAAKKSSAPAKKADGKTDRVTVKSIIIAGLKAKKDPETIVKEVQKKFPDSNTGTKDVSWYKWKMSQE